MSATMQGQSERQARPLNVMMTGLRGFPNVQGGVEKHVEQLAPLLAEAGCQIEILARSPYLSADAPSSWRGVTITRIWTPRSRSFEAIAHTFLCVLYAGIRRPDILHIHAIGPSLLTPLARGLGLNVVVTHHGFDYDRGKWGAIAKAMLRAGEYLGMRFATARIAVSSAIAKSVQERFKVTVVRIPNGVAIEPAPAAGHVLADLGLERQRYILMVGRLVPEKRHLDAIEAFKRLRPPGWKLVIVGASDHPDGYVRALKMVVDKSEGVLMAGFRTGGELAELYTQAGVFVLPSSHEGLPIALLEALGYGLPVLASDIDANTEVGMARESYFPVRDIGALAAGLARVTGNLPDAQLRPSERDRILSDYGWPQIAELTHAIYCDAAGLSETCAAEPSPA